MTNFIFIISCLLAVLLFVTFFTRKKLGTGFFHLLLICSVFWGGIFYFFYGFPLDEGVVPASKLVVYERGFAASIALLVISTVLLVGSFFLKRK